MLCSSSLVGFCIVGPLCRRHMYPTLPIPPPPCLALPPPPSAEEKLCTFVSFEGCLRMKSDHTFLAVVYTVSRRKFSIYLMKGCICVLRSSRLVPFFSPQYKIHAPNGPHMHAAPFKLIFRKCACFRGWVSEKLSMLRNEMSSNKGLRVSKRRYE